MEAEKRNAVSVLSRAFLRMCRRNMRRSKIADSTGTEMTGASLLMRTLVLRRMLARKMGRDEKFVGLLLPPSAGAVLANAALAIDRRVPVNLNYTLSSEVLNSCISQCGIRHVVTSRRAMEKFHVHLNAELLYLEDIVLEVRAADKLAAGLAAWALPMPILERLLGLHHQQGNDLLTVIFTSGSTGEPKGVMLSHDNVASNIEAIHQVMQLNKNDVLAGILPFFHSTGSTVTLWTVLALDPKGVYHFNPLDAQQVGKLCGKHRATFFVATPTFLRAYLRRCQPEDFASLEVVITGAEKLPADLATAFEKKFGVRPLEGYGATELSPLVSVNVPASRMMGNASGAKEGTVGRPVPGVAVKVVDPESGRELPAGEAGMLCAKGPNVMQGYLHRPDLTAQVIQDGWYVTGDIAELDADGFIRITGRVSRFSKIGGEMVPHILVEETLQRVLAADENELKAAVAAVPDARRGERLVVFHTSIDKTPEQVCKDLAEAGLPNLWIPSPDSFCEVESMPVLGTGKLDLKALQQLAQQKFAEPAPAR